MNQDAKPIMTLRHVSKRFGATQALDDVSLDIWPGEVQALIGENGAGKSTLIKIMTGIYQPDQGEIRMDGEPIRVRNSQEAQAYGIAAIYQEPMVFPDLNVAENIFISHRNFGPIVRWKQMYQRADEILTQLDIKLDVRQPARGLTLAAQQAVEIAKAISLDAKVLIMDEPTASLSAHEVHQLFKLVDRLRKKGVAILFIGHRLEEVFEIADRITVLRDGKFIASHPAGEVTTEQVIQEMVGREVEDFFAKTTAQIGDTVLEVKNLGKEGVFSGINFEVHHGEVLGFAGLVGSRRTDVGLALFGIEPADEGQIVLDGQEIAIKSPKQALERGIAYMSEDRRQLGLVLPMSIPTNITLPTLKAYLNGLGLVQKQREKSIAEKFRERLSIRTPSLETPVAQLSGGNQQKVMLAKWLNASPKLLILDEPTRGIDVGAKADVHQLVDELAEQGLAIIVISSDLPEVLSMSDRILVMREGRQMGIFSRDEATQEVIMTAAMGQSNADTEEEHE
jgi:rhamnose transport system ATP-binding protein